MIWKHLSDLWREGIIPDLLKALALGLGALTLVVMIFKLYLDPYSPKFEVGECIANVNERNEMIPHDFQKDKIFLVKQIGAKRYLLVQWDYDEEKQRYVRNGPFEENKRKVHNKTDKLPCPWGVYFKEIINE